MTPEKQIEKLREIQFKIDQAKTFRKGWGQVIKELTQQLADVINGEQVEQTEILNRLPPRPERPENA